MKTSPGRGGDASARTAATDSAMAPRWTGLSAAWAGVAPERRRHALGPPSQDDGTPTARLGRAARGARIARKLRQRRLPDRDDPQVDQLDRLANPLVPESLPVRRQECIPDLPGIVGGDRDRQLVALPGEPAVDIPPQSRAGELLAAVPQQRAERTPDVGRLQPVVLASYHRELDGLQPTDIGRAF